VECIAGCPAGRSVSRLANYLIGNAKQVFGFRRDSNKLFPVRSAFPRARSTVVEKMAEIVMA
jgi:hypothetical protein